MEREDFKEMNTTHVLTCETIINNNGRCDGIDCCKCPFHQHNTYHAEPCSKFYSSKISTFIKNPKLTRSCNEFITLYRKTIACDINNSEAKIKELNNIIEKLKKENEILKDCIGKLSDSIIKLTNI